MTAPMAPPLPTTEPLLLLPAEPVPAAPLPLAGGADAPACPAFCTGPAALAPVQTIVASQPASVIVPCRLWGFDCKTVAIVAALLAGAAALRR
jgi:hypothetical protein